MGEIFARFTGPTAHFFHWWFGELSMLVPPGLRRVAGGDRGAVVIDLSGSEIVVTEQGRRKAREIGRIPAAGEADAARDIAASRLLGRARRRNSEVTLRLAGREALRKNLSLPAAAGDNLRQVLTFEMDRQTPFAADQVYFDHRIRGRRPDGQIDVELVTVPRDIVDSAVRRVAAWGVAPDRVDVPAQGDDPWTPDLLAASRPEAGSSVRWPNLALASIALILAAAVLYVPLERRQNEHARLQAELARAKSGAELALGLRKEIDRMVVDAGFLIRHKHESVKSVLLLEELTRLIPDDTWLQRFQLNGREVRISGHSASASRLVTLIEESQAFEKVVFRSPVTQDQRSGKERFNLSLRIVGPKTP